MKKLIAITLFFFSAVISIAQTKPVQDSSVGFPQALMGKWKGTLTWFTTDKPAKTFVMRLNILPADSGRFTWQIIYGDDMNDNRSYTLKQVDAAKGHWIVDENNSIILDSYWIGNRFTGVFSVNNSTILDQYWIEQDGLHVEFISYETAAVSITGGTSNDIPPVSSYKIKSLQRGVLTRVN